MSEQISQFKLPQQPTDGFNPKTVKLTEIQLEKTIVENYMKLAARTGKLHFQVDREAQRVSETALKPVCTFIVLPRTYANVMPHWMIELHFPEHSIQPIGVELADHVVLGVTRYGNRKPDLDLTGYAAHDKGVSRRHALLLCGYQTLSLVDLGSTNGTWVDGTRITAHQPVALNTHSVIGLGEMAMLLRIVSTPSDLGMSKDS
jgi:hypothetical protein